MANDFEAPSPPDIVSIAALVRGQSSGRIAATNMVAGKAHVNEIASDARTGQREPNGRELPRIELPFAQQ